VTGSASDVWEMAINLMCLSMNCHNLPSQDKHFVHVIPPSLAVEASVMQHLQHGINSLSKFTIARRLPLYEESEIISLHFYYF